MNGLTENCQRLRSILWTVEIIIGVLPAFVMITAGLIPYLMVLPFFPSMFLSGNAQIVRSAIVLNGTMIGGILGIAAIFMAYHPERLRQSAKLKRLTITFGCAGICAGALYVMSEGLTDVMSNGLKCWIVAGPVLVGSHCAYRVLARPRGSH